MWNYTNDPTFWNKYVINIKANNIPSIILFLVCKKYKYTLSIQWQESDK